LYRILLVVICLILYGSLYPWDFHASELAGNPLWLLWDSWPVDLDRSAFRDICINVTLYVPLGMFGFLAFPGRRRRWMAAAATLLLGLTLSSSIEMIQLFDRTRDTSMLDVVTNVCGAAVGIALAVMYRETLRRALSERTVEMLFHPSGSLLLLYCWLGYQVFPLFPALSLSSLRLKIAALLSSSSFSALPALASFAQWLAIAKLLETVVGAKRVRRFMGPLLLLVPLRAFIADRTFTGSELMGAIAAYLAWQWRPARHGSVVAGWFVAMLVLTGLAPFHFQSHAAVFSWIPFRALLESSWTPGFVVFLRKSFCYGAGLWLLREAGVSLVSATAGVSLLLAGIEAIQIYLPGRTPESTDPVLAVIMALILWLLEKHHRSEKAVIPHTFRI
jgi:VanZ family protein